MLIRNYHQFAGILVIAATFSTQSYAIPTTQQPDSFVHKTYDGFEVIINCEKKGAQLFMATIGPDTGNRRRESADFALDPSVPSDCQQSSTEYYPPGLHRGHLIGANSVENSQKGYEETFYMTNVLPMTKQLNVGAWHKSDEIIECLREQGRPVKVLGGPVWTGAHASNITKAKHGVTMPNAYWKILIQGEYQVAWVMPNSKEPTRNTLRQWEATVDEIETLIGFEIPEDLELYRNYRPENWYITKGCDLK